ncbi:MAG TPA: co-chaperone GroES [Lentisphaeria bacterium]|nr:co-chaperone GroES [Lentisphaeria bacterium]|tara:strand:+ start:1978 stop:2268 length:291 start_codon:yes stop_codon:yes gene_type:complete
MKIKPLGDRVLLQVADGEEQQIKGGIVIPDSAKEKPQEAKIVALGTGGTDDDGNKIKFDVKVGDLVLTNKYGGTDVTVDDEEYKIVKSEDILAVVG